MAFDAPAVATPLDRIDAAIAVNPERSRVTLRREDARELLRLLGQERALNASQTQGLELLAGQLRSVRQELWQADNLTAALTHERDAALSTVADLQLDVANLQLQRDECRDGARRNQAEVVRLQALMAQQDAAACEASDNSVPWWIVWACLPLAFAAGLGMRG